MKINYQKVVSFILIFSILFLNVAYFLKPKIAKADTGAAAANVAATCGLILAEILGFQLAGTAATVAASGFFVGTYDPVTGGMIYQTAGSSLKDTTIKGCLDAIFYFAAKALLDQLTASLVQWINSGFEGSPSFITNPGQFFLDAADNNAVQFLDSLFTEGGGQSELSKLLCSPFKFDLKIKFALNYSYNSGKFFHSQGCRISDIGNNINGFVDSVKNFTDKNFKEGGWERWFQMTQNSSSNIFGSEFEVDSQFAKKIGIDKEIEDQKLAWGNGFQSAETKLSNGIKEIVTPGATINAQLTRALGSGYATLELADNFNEVVGALFGQLTNQIFGPGDGLRGASQGGANSVASKLRAQGTKNSADFSTGSSTIGGVTQGGLSTTTIKTITVGSTTLNNLALNSDIATTSESSVLFCGGCASGSWHGVAAHGADGNRNGNVSSAMAITQNQHYSWWEVNLGTTSKIYRVDVYPSTNQSDVLDHIAVFISKNPFPQNALNAATTTGVTPAQTQDWPQVLSRVSKISLNQSVATTVPPAGSLINTTNPAGDTLMLQFDRNLANPPEKFDINNLNGGQPFEGQFVRVQRYKITGDNRLFLAEVEVYGSQENTNKAVVQ